MKKLLITFLLLVLFAFKAGKNKATYTVPLRALAVCTTDYDLDGDPDIAITHGFQNQTTWGGVYLLENDGYGNFSYMDSIFDSVGIYQLYVNLILSDSYPDLIYHFNGKVHILSTDGNSYSISDFITGTDVNSFAIGDVNGDTYKDILFRSSLDHYWGAIYNQNGNSFSEPEYHSMEYHPMDIVAADLNSDSFDDVIVTGPQSIINYSTGNEFITQALPQNVERITVADLDNNNSLDIAGSIDLVLLTHVYLFKNLGNNLFETINDFLAPEGCSDFFMEDFNNDSLPDLLLLLHDFPKGYLLYYNQGNFQFGDSVYIPMQAYGEAWRNTACADLDGNGYIDIVTTRQNFDTTTVPSILEILFNDGQGNFIENPVVGIQTSNFEPQTSNFTYYPNPFKDNINLEFNINEDSFAEVLVYDLKGKLVNTIYSKNLNKGHHLLIWNGRDKNGKEVKAGTYLVCLNAGRQTETRRIIKLTD